MTRIIAIASGKGGVGKTTSVVNLGLALEQFNQNVIVLDANLTTPNVGLHLGIHGPFTTLNNVLEGDASITDAIYMHDSGLRVVPAGMHLKHLKTTDPDRLWDAVLDLFGSADIVIMDTPAGLEKGAQAVLDTAEELLIVTNPEMPAVTDALKTIRVAKKAGAHPIGVVLNKVKNNLHEMKDHDIESMLDLHIIGRIPHDDEVINSINLKKPILLRAPKSPAAKAFKKLAADLVGVEYELEREGRPIVDMLKKLFGIV